MIVNLYKANLEIIYHFSYIYVHYIVYIKYLIYKYKYIK